MITSAKILFLNKVYDSFQVDKTFEGTLFNPLHGPSSSPLDYSEILFYTFLVLFIYFLAVLGLHCCIGFSLVAASRGYSLTVLHRLLTAVTSRVAEHGL